MELKGECRLDADRATAWAALNDTELLRACIPGCENITPTAEHAYELTISVAIGPVKARFKGRMTLTDIVAPERYTINFEGQGGVAGFARGDAQVSLQQVDAHATTLTYAATAQVGGKLAQLGSRLIDAAAIATTEKFFASFAGELAARSGAPPAGAPRATARAGLWSKFLAFLRRLFKTSRS